MTDIIVYLFTWLIWAIVIIFGLIRLLLIFIYTILLKLVVAILSIVSTVFSWVSSWIWAWWQAYCAYVGTESTGANIAYWIGCAVITAVIVPVLFVLWNVFCQLAHEMYAKLSNSTDDDDDYDDDDDEEKVDRFFRANKKSYRPYVSLDSDEYVVKKLSRDGSGWILSVGKRGQLSAFAITRIAPMTTGGHILGIRYQVEWGQD